MKHGTMEKPSDHENEPELDFRTEEQAKKDMREKVKAGKINELDTRERKLWEEQKEDERQDDNPRYGN